MGGPGGVPPTGGSGVINLPEQPIGTAITIAVPTDLKGLENWEARSMPARMDRQGNFTEPVKVLMEGEETTVYVQKGMEGLVGRWKVASGGEPPIVAVTDRSPMYTDSSSPEVRAGMGGATPEQKLASLGKGKKVAGTEPPRMPQGKAGVTQSYTAIIASDGKQREIEFRTNRVGEFSEQITLPMQGGHNKIVFVTPEVAAEFRSGQLLGIR